MNTPHRLGNWDLAKARLKMRYPHLADEELTCADGGETEMLDRLERRLDKSPMEMAMLIEEVLDESSETTRPSERPPTLLEAPPW
jgi:hypothetical protein